MSADECPFRPGQLVRADFEDGTSITGLVKPSLPIHDGLVKSHGGEDLVFGYGTRGETATLWPERRRITLRGATLTVVREPIPEEPTGRHALFEDSHGVVWWRSGNADWYLVGDTETVRSWREVVRRGDGGRVVFAGEQP